jgi:hypothetical protein
MGIHTENTNLLPTKDLPWAFPLQPITSAGISGIGTSPTGPVEGTWVVCIFRDEGSFQEPIMMGTIGGIPEEKEQKLDDAFQGKAGTRYEGTKDLTGVETDATDSEESKTLRDSQGNPVLDSSGNAVKSGNANVLNQVDGVPITPKAAKGDFKVGEMTGKHESNERIDAINDYKKSAIGDFGGASYGKYQMASYMLDPGTPKNNNANNSPVKRFIAGSKYSGEFAGLVPATPEFDKKWKAVAAKDPKGFEDAQREYIVANNYTPVLNSLRTDGIDLTGRGPAVQEMVFSTGTQYGSGKPIKRALAGKNLSSMSDADIVKAVQQDKLKNIDKDFRSSSENIRNGVKARITREEKRLVELAGDDAPIDKEDVEAIQKKQETDGTAPEDTPEEELANKDRPTGSINVKPIPASGVTEPRTIAVNDKPGFQDPYSVYPRKKWLNEQDVSRLARNEKIDETIMKAKEQTLIKGVGTAGGGSWDEPKSKYNAVYPLNHVTQTESGHTVEYDDTPSAERIHVYHRAGSFIEWHPDGTVVYKSVKDQFEVTVKDRNIYVGGSCNITVEGNTNIYTKGVLNMESDGDMNIKTGSNLTIGAEGQAFIMSNGDMHVGSGANLHEGASNILMNCSWYPPGTSAGDYAVGKISVEVYDDDENVPTVSALDESATIAAQQADGTLSPSRTGASAPVVGADGVAKSTSTEPVKEMDNLEKSKADETAVEKTDDPKGSDMISKNYRLADVTTSPVLSKVALKDQGSLTKQQIRDNLSAVAQNVLEPIRARYGSEFIITSAFRSGSGTSQHLKGQAVDIQFPGISKEQYVHRIQEIAKILPGYDQMILEYHGRNPVIHISYNSNGNRSQRKSTPNLSTYYSGFRDASMGQVYP